MEAIYMGTLMEKARAGKALADSYNDRKKEVEFFLGVFYPAISAEKKQKILNAVE